MTAVDAIKGYDTCGGTTRRGTPCTRPAGWGTEHAGVGTCKLHLGCTEAHNVHAGRLLAERRVGELLVEFGRDPATVDSHAEVLEVVALTAGMVFVYGRLVAELRAGAPAVDGDGDQAEEAGGLWGPDHKGDARPHEAVRALGEWTDRHLRACKTAGDMGIAQRQIEIAEGQAEIIAGVLRHQSAGSLETVRQAIADGVDPVAALEAALPGVMRGALELARPGVVDVHETKET